MTDLATIEKELKENNASDAYIAGYMTAVEQYAEEMHKINARSGRRVMRRRINTNMVKQKVLGGLLVVVSVLGIAALGGDASVAVFTIPAGGYLFLTRKEIFN